MSWTPPPWDDGLTVFSTVVSRPDTPPIDPKVVQSHLNLSQVSGDLARYLHRAQRAAWSEAEARTGRALTRQQWALSLSGWPRGGRPVEFPSPPFVEVGDITYIDTAGVTQTWGGSPPPFHTDGENARIAKGRLFPNVGESWPSIACGHLSPIRIAYTCGYDGNAPDEILWGMLLVIGELFKIRTESIQDVSSTSAYRTAKSQWGEWHQ